MATAPAFDDLFDAAEREALARPTRLTPDIIRVQGSDVNIAIAAGAAMSEEVAQYAQGEINETRLRTAGSVSDEALEQYITSELGGETRNGALAAIVPLEWSRSPGAGTTVPAGTIVGTDGGVTFETVTAVAFSNTEIGPLTTTGVATTTGPGGNVIKGAITRVLSSLDDLTLTVFNPEPASGGQVAELIEDFQARGQTAYQRAGRGILSAIEATAAATQGVISARAFELLNGNAQTGRVVVQVLGAGGTSNAALSARVLTNLRSSRCAGVPVIVQALSPVSIEITAVGLRIDDQFDAGSVLEAAREAVVAFIDGLQVGGELFKSDIIGTLRDIEGLRVPDGAVSSPVSDVTPQDGTYLTTTTDLVSLTAAS